MELVAKNRNVILAAILKQIVKNTCILLNQGAPWEQHGALGFIQEIVE